MSKAKCGAKLTAADKRLVKELRQEGTSRKCVECQTQLGIPMLCGSCRATAYCSADCQKRDWPQHRKICQAMAAKKISGKKTEGEKG